MQTIKTYTMLDRYYPRLFLVSCFFILLLALLVGISLKSGYDNMSFRLLWSAISGQQLDELPTAIVHYLALPRVMMAIIAGIGMAVSGCLLQQSLQNDFASPATLGVNVGAMTAVLACGVVAAEILIQWSIVVAFIGGALTAAIVYLLARSISPAPMNLILVGMAVSLGLGAISAGMLMMFEGRLDGFYIWGAGNLAQANNTIVNRIIPIIGVLSVVSVLLTRRLDFLALGDNIANNLGIHVRRLRLVSVVLAVLISATVVSGVGIISFIGLVAPHIARALGAKKMLSRLLLSAAIGSVLLLSADIVSLLLSRADYLIPAGALTTLVGAPFMMVLLRQQLSQQRHSLGRAQEDYELGIGSLFNFSNKKVFIVLTTCLLAAVIWTISGDEPLSIGLPRTLVAALAGMALAVSGFILHIILRNPLASPDIVGVTSVSILAVVLVSAVIPLTRTGIVSVSLFSIFLVVVLAYLWLRGSAFSAQRWALMGVCLSAFCGTGVTVIMSLSATQSSEALLWLSGATYGVGYDEVFWLLPVLAIIGLLLFGPWRWLHVLQLGLVHSNSLGLDSRRALLTLGALVVVCCALCVSVVGGIAFVGLMAPHLVRALGVTHTCWCLPTTAVMGALLLILADTLAINMLAPFELPSGLVVSAIGGLYFILLLVSGKYIRGR